MLSTNYMHRLKQNLGFASELWVGYLPSGAEKILGVPAKITQNKFGLSIGLTQISENLVWSIPVGLQRSSAKVTGGITSAEALDTFTANTTLIFVSPILFHKKFGIFGEILFANKNTESIFTIPSDSTRFKIKDNLKDASLPVAIQLSIGWKSQSSTSVSLSELLIPNRLSMPRLSLAYHKSFIAETTPVTRPRKKKEKSRNKRDRT
jgi:hypothetical protein